MESIEPVLLSHLCCHMLAHTRCTNWATRPARSRYNRAAGPPDPDTEVPSSSSTHTHCLNHLTACTTADRRVRQNHLVRAGGGITLETKHVVQMGCLLRLKPATVVRDLPGTAPSDPGDDWCRGTKQWGIFSAHRRSMACLAPGMALLPRCSTTRQAGRSKPSLRSRSAAGVNPYPRQCRGRPLCVPTSGEQCPSVESLHGLLQQSQTDGCRQRAMPGVKTITRFVCATSYRYMYIVVAALSLSVNFLSREKFRKNSTHLQPWR